MSGCPEARGYAPCHSQCALGPNRDHFGYLGYRCVDGASTPLPWPGEDGYPTDTFLCDGCGRGRTDLSNCRHWNLCEDCANACTGCDQDRADDKASGA